MTTYRIFTCDDGYVDNYAWVESFQLKGADVTIPAILIGEEGRGRELGVLPVSLSPEMHRHWEAEGKIKIEAASIGQTRRGTPKLLPPNGEPTNEHAILVLRTPIGFRGSNDHTGDRIGWQCTHCDHKEYTTDDPPDECTNCGHKNYSSWDIRLLVKPLEGRILCKGVIAQGAAGRAGWGEQMIILVPRNVVIRTAYSGRRYGAPRAHYWVFNGEKVLCATWQERLISDIF